MAKISGDGSTVPNSSKWKYFESIQPEAGIGKSKCEMMIDRKQSNLYWNGRETDFTILIAGKVIHAHKLILSACIPYFEAMFSAGLEEDQCGKVELKDIDPDAIQMIIDYVYTGKLKINYNNLQALVVAGDFLQFETIIDYCYEYLKKYIDFDLVLNHIIGCPVLRCFPKFTNFIEKFIFEHFERVWRLANFPNITYDQLFTIISSDELEVENELNTFQSIMKWIKHDLPSRKSKLAPLFREIRLHLMKKEDLVDFVLRESLVLQDSECDEYLYKAILFHRRPNGQDHSAGPWSRQRKFTKYLYLLQSFGYKMESSQCFKSGRLEPSPISHELIKMPERWFDYCTVLLGTSLYILGGQDETGPTNRVWLLDPQSNTITNVPSLNVARRNAAAAVVGDKIYVCGGMDGHGKLLSSVECWSPGENQWTLKSPMNRGRYEHSVRILDRFLYAINGRMEDSIERYDTILDLWELMPPDFCFQ